MRLDSAAIDMVWQTLESLVVACVILLLLVSDALKVIRWACEEVEEFRRWWVALKRR